MRRDIRFGRAVPAAAGMVALASACMVGPTYQEPAVAPAEATLGAAPAIDTLRPFYDSLARMAAEPMRPAPLTVDPSDLAWLDILRDTTLTQLVALAVQENRDVRTAAARVAEFRAQLGVGRAALLPDVRGTAAASTNQIAVGSLAPQSFDALLVRADLQWELDFWGRIRQGTRASQGDLEAEEAGYQAALLSLVSDVATAYLSVLELRQEEAIAERTLASRRATLALARDRFARGVISELDVRQFESQAAVPAAALAQARRLRAQREHQLAALVGRMPFTVPVNRDLAAVVAAIELPDSIPAALLGRRPDVRAAERRYAAAVARIGAAQAARLPTVSITGYYGSQAATADMLFGSNAEVYQLQGGVSVPLFTGGRLSNQVKVAEARAEQARWQFEGAALQAFREASDALVAVRTAREQRMAKAGQVAALRRAAELANLRYRGGVASYLEVLEAERGLFAAELELSQTRLLELTSVVQLYKALGGHWEGQP